MSRFMWEEEELDEWEERRVREAMLEKVAKQTGRLDVDAMAHEDGRNAVAEKWYSKRAQPFEEEWKEETAWRAPPRHMCRQVAKFLRSRVKEKRAGRPALMIPAAERVQERGNWEGWRTAWRFPRGTKLWRPARGYPPPREDETTSREARAVAIPSKM